MRTLRKHVELLGTSHEAILGIFDPEKVAAGSHEEWKSLEFSNYWSCFHICFPIEFSNDVSYIQLGTFEAYLQLITHEADAMPLAFGNEERRNAPRHWGLSLRYFGIDQVDLHQFVIAMMKWSCNRLYFAFPSTECHGEMSAGKQSMLRCWSLSVEGTARCEASCIHVAVHHLAFPALAVGVLHFVASWCIESRVITTKYQMMFHMSVLVTRFVKEKYFFKRT